MRWREGLGLAAFCLLAGSRWLVESAWPGALPPLEEQGLHLGLIGLVAGGVWVVRGDGWLPGTGWVAAAGLLLLGVPALLNAVAVGAVAEDGAALATMVPVCVVTAAAAFGASAGGRSLMMPALAGLAGGLLLLPFQVPSTLTGGVMLGALVLGVASTAVGCVWLHGLLRGVGLARAVAVVCVANGVLLGLAGMMVEHARLTRAALPGELLRCGLVDAPALWLLVWLLRDVAPARVSSRYLFAPLVTVAEGAVLLRTQPDARMWIGALLMLVSGGILVFGRESEGAPGLGLRDG